ncbi:MAG: hypothetical protein ACRC7N_19080 [Clostridium sp.]
MENIYTLYSKDKPLIDFKKIDTLERKYEIIRLYEDNKNILPYRLKHNIDTFDSWLDSRPIPTNREHIEKVIDALMLSERPDPFDYLKINNGVSLNDTYWIKSSNDEISWYDKDFSSVNLYEDGFKESLGIITFFGNTSSLGGRINTPELTTQGMLGKAWRQQSDGIYLYKKGSSGAANAGNEPYSEVIASQVASIIGISYVNYELEKWQGVLCTKCKLFTDVNYGYLTMAEFLGTEIGTNDRWKYSDIKSLVSEDIMEGIDDMIVFDYIIENKDRHFNNFGFIRNNNTGEIEKLAPIFDNGFSLLNFHMEYELKEFDYDAYSDLGTFYIKNKDQASEVIKRNPKKYKNWAKELSSKIDTIDFNGVEEYRERAIKELLKSRCRIIQSL